METLHDLLMSCPEDQITRMQLAWKAGANGEWEEVVHFLSNAAKEGSTDWHVRVGQLAKNYKALTPKYDISDLIPEGPDSWE